MLAHDHPRPALGPAGATPAHAADRGDPGEVAAAGPGQDAAHADLLPRSRRPRWPGPRSATPSTPPAPRGPPVLCSTARRRRGCPRTCPCHPARRRPRRAARPAFRDCLPRGGPPHAARRDGHPPAGRRDLCADWHGADAVLGLCDDGGYWAIGLRRYHPASSTACPCRPTTRVPTSSPGLSRKDSRCTCCPPTAMSTSRPTPRQPPAQHPHTRFARTLRRIVGDTRATPRSCSTPPSSDGGVHVEGAAGGASGCPSCSPSTPGWSCPRSTRSS